MLRKIDIVFCLLPQLLFEHRSIAFAYLVAWFCWFLIIVLPGLCRI